MKVAVLTSRWPWPLEKGDKLRLYHQLRSLHPDVELHLISLVDEEPGPEARAAVAPYVASMTAVKLSRWRRAVRLAWAPLSSRPFQVHWFYQRKAHRQVVSVLGQIQPDHLFTQLIRTTEYVKDRHAIPRTLDYMDALSAGMERRAVKHFGPLRWLYALEARRLKRYEATVFDYFDAHTIITAADRQAIGHPERERIAVVPNGVDTDYFMPADAPPPPPVTVSFIGNMAYPPNVDAAARLVRNILPELPSDVRCLIAGATPTATVRNLASDRVDVTGWVEDIRNAYHRSHVFAAPIVLGSGQQNKILEAMACGVPCVISPQVHAGLGPELRVAEGPLNAEVVCGVQAVLARTTEDAAMRLAELVSDAGLRLALAQNARRFVETHASWSGETKKLLATFADVPVPKLRPD